MNGTLAYYITAHGYGHGVRSCDALRAFHTLQPDVELVVVTDLPEAFLRNRLPGVPFQRRAHALDVGMVQLDSIRVDVAQTLSTALDLCARHSTLQQQEAEFLQRRNVSLVVSDIPGIPIAAAAQVGIPRYAIGNFSWSWIYEDFVAADPRWQTVIDCFAADYAQADLLLRLPFAEPMTAFPVRRDVSLLASPGTPQRDRLAALTGASPEQPWILLSFSTLEWDAEALARVTALRDYAFFTVKPLAWDGANLFAVDREQMPFSSVLASVDAVVTKPGFGILSECVVNQKPMIYVEREDFREYPVLEAAVQQHLRHLHLPARDLYAGNLQGALADIWSRPAPREPVPADGGQQVAGILINGIR